MKSFFTKTKVLIYIIIALICFNIATLTAFYFRSHDFDFGPRDRLFKPRHGNIDFLKQKLELKDSQEKVFDSLNEAFKERGRVLMDSMQVTRKKIVDNITSEHADTALIAKLNQDLGKMHVELRKNAINFYMELRQVCNTQQQDSLKMIFAKMMEFEGGRPFKMHMHGGRPPFNDRERP